jgi:hypothetical protein
VPDIHKRKAWGVPVVLERKLALRGNDLFYEGTSCNLNSTQFSAPNRIFATVVSA